MSKECGQPDCSVSTEIMGHTSFGRGELDDFGYWEFPCGICARAWEKKFPEDSPCWPFEPKLHTNPDSIDMEKVKDANIRSLVGPDYDD